MLFWIAVQQLAPLQFILPRGLQADLWDNVKVPSKEVVYTEQLTATID